MLLIISSFILVFCCQWKKSLFLLNLCVCAQWWRECRVFFMCSYVRSDDEMHYCRLFFFIRDLGKDKRVFPVKHRRFYISFFLNIENALFKNSEWFVRCFTQSKTMKSRGENHVWEWYNTWARIDGKQVLKITFFVCLPLEAHWLCTVRASHH